VSGTSPRWSEQQSAQVAELIRRLQDDARDSADRQATRDRIVEMHLPLVRYLAGRLAGRTESFEDLVQVGVIGLLKAIDRFDPTLGKPFATYAAPTVTGEIKHHLRDTGWLVRVPRRAQELRAGVIRAVDELSHASGRSPTVSEIAAHLGIASEEVAEALDVARARTPTPLDELLDTEDGPGMQGLVAEVDQGFEQVEDRVLLAEAMSRLSDQEREVVRLRFDEGKTQSEIAAIIGVSQMQVSRLLSRSVVKMRETMDTEPQSSEVS